MVKANGHTIRCKFVVIATHVPLQGATGTVSAALFQTKLAAYSTYAVGAQIPKGSAPQASFWDTADPYFYLRIEHRKTHDYAILGGADHKTGQARDPERHYARVEKRLHQLLPKAKVDHRWSGQVIETNDGLPFIGETAPGQFVATGFSGNGMTFGTVGAMMAADAFAKRKNPWSQLFDVNRKKLSGVWDYLVENKDYPFYMAKEWLAKPGASSLARCEARRRQDRRAGWQQGGRVSRRQGKALGEVGRLHAHGLHRPLERRGENLGLPVPRLTLPSDR